MIRQAISCDICAREMQNPNHWFVAYDSGAELRVIRWGFRSRLRASARHLCGQTCLHKLVDEFMARPSTQTGAAIQEEKQPAPLAAGNIAICASSIEDGVNDRNDGSIDAFESSARLIPSSPPQPTPLAESAASSALTLMPRVTQAEAWKREREREERASTHSTRLSRSTRSQSIA